MLNNQLASFAASGQLSKQKPKPKPTLVDVEIAGKTVEMEIPLQPNDPNFTKEIDKRARAIERDMFKKKIITKMVGASNIKGEELRKQAAALRAKGDIQGASDLLGQRANLLATGQDQKPQSDKVGSASIVGNLPPALGVPLTIGRQALNTKEAKAVKKTVGDAFNRVGNVAMAGNIVAGQVAGKAAEGIVKGAGVMANVPAGVSANVAKQAVAGAVPMFSKEGVKAFNPLESTIVELFSNPDQYLTRVDQEGNKAKQGDALAALNYALLVGGPVLDVLGGMGSAAAIVERLSARLGKKAAEKAAARTAKFAEQVPDIEALGAQFRPLKPGQSTRDVSVSFRQPAKAAEPVPAPAPVASPVETLARIASDEPILALPARSQFSQEVDQLRRVAEQPPVAPAPAPAPVRAPEVVQPNVKPNRKPLTPEEEAEFLALNEKVNAPGRETEYRSKATEKEKRRLEDLSERRYNARVDFIDQKLREGLSPDDYKALRESLSSQKEKADAGADRVIYRTARQLAQSIVSNDDAFTRNAFEKQWRLALTRRYSEMMDLYADETAFDLVNGALKPTQTPPVDPASNPIDDLARIANDQPVPAQPRPEPYRPTTPADEKWNRALDVAVEDYHWDIRKVRPEDERLLRAIANREGFDLPPLDSEDLLYVWDDFKQAAQRSVFESKPDPARFAPEAVEALRKVGAMKGREGYTEVKRNAQRLWRPVKGGRLSFIDLEDIPFEFRQEILQESERILSGRHFMPSDQIPAFLKRGGGNKETVPVYYGDELLYKEARGVGSRVDEEIADAASKTPVPLQAVRSVLSKYRAVVRETKDVAKAEATANRGDLLKAIEHYNPRNQTNAIPIQKTDVRLLGEERPQVGLQEVGKGNAEPQVPAQQGQAQAQEVVPEPGVNTGIKNAVQETEIEQGLIRSASPKFGKTQDEIKASIEGARGRSDYDQVAEQISKGGSFNAESFAVAMQGDRAKRANVTATSKALNDAIEAGAPEEQIADLRKAFDAALDDRQAYLDKIQKGKSEWSNIGRTLAQEVEVDTGNVADVLQFAQAKKGSKLTDQEVVELRKVVDERNRQVAELETRLKEAESIALREARVTSATRRVKREKADIRSERKILIEDFLSEVSKASSYLAGASPEAILKFAKIVRNVIEEGYTTFDDIAEFLRKNGLPDTEPEDVIKALAEPLPRKAKIETEITKLRREAKKIAMDARKAENQTDEAQKRLTRLKENTQKRIDSLQEQLNTGQFAERQPRRQTEADIELYRLRIKKKMLENQVKAAIEAKAPVSKARNIGSVLTEVKLANPFGRILDVASNVARMTGYLGGNVPRSIMDAGLAKLTKGVQVESILTPERIRRIAARSKERMKMDLEMIRKAQDPDTIKKFGTGQGPFSKLAGMTDIPFKSFYFETAVDQGAEAMARRTLGLKASKAEIADFRDQIIRDLDQYPELEAAAHEFSLYMTYNGDNWASRFTSYAKRDWTKGNEVANVVFDEFVGRFARVITNVATDAANRTVLSPVAVGRGLAKITNDMKGLDPKTRLEALELMGKGLIGTAIAYLGYKLADKVPGEIKGERSKYIDYGDWGKIGGPAGAFLFGVTIAKAEKLPETQKAQLLARTFFNAPLENPLVSNVKGILDVAAGSMDFRQFAAKKISNMVIPGGVRDLAERTDVEPGTSILGQIFNTGKSIEREKYPKEKTREFVRGKGMQSKEKTTKDFGKILQGEFKSKIPGLRQQLPKKDK